MNKRLSIFDLQEGCTYAAFDGNRKLGRTYKVTDGKLFNDEGSEGGHYVGCSWVPVKASTTFEKIAGPSNGSNLQSSKASATNVLGLIEGVTYQATGLGEVVRKGDSLHTISNGKVGIALSLDRVDLKLAFRPLAVQPKTAIAAKPATAKSTGKTPKNEFQCGFEQVQIEAPSFFKLLALNELKWTQRKNENGAFVFGFKHGHIVTSTDPLTGEHMDGGAPEIGQAGSIGVEGTKAFRDRVAKFLKRNAEYSRYDKSERKFI